MISRRAAISGSRRRRRNLLDRHRIIRPQLQTHFLREATRPFLLGSACRLIYRYLALFVEGRLYETNGLELFPVTGPRSTLFVFTFLPTRYEVWR